MGHSDLGWLGLGWTGSRSKTEKGDNAISRSAQKCSVKKAGEQVLKVVDVKTYAVANPPPHGGRSWIFMRLTTDEGIVGFGEAYTHGLQPSPRTTVQLIQDVGKGLLSALTRSTSNDCGGNSIMGVMLSIRV